jgi:hypothetical protein
MQAITHLPSQSILVAATTIPTTPHTRYASTHARTRMPTNWRTAGPIDFIASFWQFQVLLTLFSKFFSPFPRGTCVLSVFHGYLALDGIYHPLRLHSQAIRLSESLPYEADSKSDTGLSPSLAPHSSGLGPGPRSGETSISYNSHPIKSNKITSLSSTSFTRRY